MVSCGVSLIRKDSGARRAKVASESDKRTRLAIVFDVMTSCNLRNLYFLLV